MAKYRKVGGGSFGVYKKEESSVWGWIAAIVIALIVIGVMT